MSKKSKSIQDLYNEIEPDKNKRKKFAQRSHDLSLARLLFTIRNSAGITQKDMAEKMNCAQGTVSKLEKTVYKDIQFGSIVDYTDACGLTPVLLFKPKEDTCMVELHYHFQGLKHAMAKLRDLCKDDAEMNLKAAEFLTQSMSSSVDMVGEFISKVRTTIKKNEKKEDVPFILGDPEGVCDKDLVAG